jgi:opacity protein-like surface antigen
MKKIPVILLVASAVAFAGLAQAAPKKRTRNLNRIGPYVTAFVGNTSYSGDQSSIEQELLDLLDVTSIPSQNLSASTDDSDIGYAAAFGYRFNRYIATELGLVQYGSLASQATGEFDFPNDNAGFITDKLELAFHVGGPLISVLGILPVNDKLELYARAGYLFASVEREFTEHIEGQGGVSGSARGDSQNLVIGIGANWNFSQVYSMRFEYEKLNDVGQGSRTGTEDLDFLSLGLIVRF